MFCLPMKADGLFFGWLDVCPFHDKDAQLVEQIDGKGHHQEGEGIARRGDDGGKYKDDDNGMTTVFRHEGGLQYAQLG